MIKVLVVVNASQPLHCCNDMHACRNCICMYTVDRYRRPVQCSAVGADERGRGQKSISTTACARAQPSNRIQAAVPVSCSCKYNKKQPAALALHASARPDGSDDLFFS